MLVAPCRGCGFDATDLSVPRVVDLLRATPRKYSERIRIAATQSDAESEAPYEGWTVDGNFSTASNRPLLAVREISPPRWRSDCVT
jgi:hypothetical protein